MHEPLAESRLRLGAECRGGDGASIDEATLLEEARERKRTARDRLIVAIRRMDPEAGQIERIIPITDPRGSQCVRREELIARMVSGVPDAATTPQSSHESHAARAK